MVEGSAFERPVIAVLLDRNAQKIDPATEQTLSDVLTNTDDLVKALNASSQVEVDIAGQSVSLDVSAATVPVSVQSPVDVGNEPLDVSGAVVTVAQDAPVQVADSNKTTIDPATETAQGPYSGLSSDEITLDTIGKNESLTGGVVIPVPSGNTVMVAANQSNNDPVYIGNGSVDIGSGYPLAPGERVPVPLDDVGNIFAVSNEQDAEVGWLVTQ